MKKFIAILLACVVCVSSRAADAVLKPNESLAICGDSITEQKLYSIYMEDYLLMCQPTSGVQVMQFGWSGERADGFLPRMHNDVLRFKPRVATMCYGMNDGKYVKLTDDITSAYRDNMSKVIDTFTMNNVRLVVGSAGCVDTYSFKRPSVPSGEEYNKTLAALRDVAKQLAEQKHLPFADVYQPMHDVMEKAKAKWGESYPIAGAADGIHPQANGHVVMAYAFLKALGVSGDIGTITVDLAAKKATATEGHTIKAMDSDAVIVESTKYPFCFFPDANNPEDDSSPNSMRGVLQFLPFNQDLNRFMLIVTGATGKVKITWGKTSKEYSAEELAKGINLAAEFLDNPFMDAFTKVHRAVLAQQAFETPMTKALVHSRLQFHDLPDDAEDSMNQLVDSATQADAHLRELAARSVTPVMHMIKIEVEK
jgi:lysophospholipase L1-like esterase